MNDNTTIDIQETKKNSFTDKEWWDPYGKFKILHKINPLRLNYIKKKICKIFNRDFYQEKPLYNLKILDVGCGCGLLCEPLSRLGAKVVGIDISRNNILIARSHAKKNSLEIDYQVSTVEAFKKFQRKFDIILNMEVIEHISNINLFISTNVSMLEKGGLILISTINRTWLAWILAIVAAEYILNWIPKGTHNYKKFLRPTELKNYLISYKLKIIEELGIKYDPIMDNWRLSSNMKINYMILAQNSI